MSSDGDFAAEQFLPEKGRSGPISGKNDLLVSLQTVTENSCMCMFNWRSAWVQSVSLWG